MIDYNNYLYLIAILVSLQTIIGVGILLLGTPILLIHNYFLSEIIFFLLPISICTSLINVIFFLIVSKTLRNNTYLNLQKKFFFSCVPGIFLGIFFLMIFEDNINIKFIVAIFILLSIILKYRFKNYILQISEKFQKIILLLIGFTHGLTNAGGSLLSIFLIIKFDNDKLKSRFSITYFYFFLATIQYIIFIFIFNKKIEIDYLFKLIPYIFIGILLGNIISKKINPRIFKLSIEGIAIIASVILLLNALNY